MFPSVKITLERDLQKHVQKKTETFQNTLKHNKIHQQNKKPKPSKKEKPSKTRSPRELSPLDPRITDHNSNSLILAIIVIT